MRKLILVTLLSLIGLSSTFATTYVRSIDPTAGTTGTNQANFYFNWSYSSNLPNGIVLGNAANDIKIIFEITDFTNGNSITTQNFNYTFGPGDTIKSGVGVFLPGLNPAHLYQVVPYMSLYQGGVLVDFVYGTPLVFQTKPLLDATPATVCSGSSTTLTATGASTTTYSWSPASSLSNANIANPIATPTVTTTYTVIATNDTVVSSNTITIIVTAVPNIATSGDVSSCSGVSSGLTASGAGTYSWFPATGLNTVNGSNVVASPTVTTTYTVTGTTNGCSNTATLTVTVNSVTITGLSSQTICSGGTGVQLTAITNGFSCSWSPTNGLSDPTISNPVANPASTTTYTVTITNGLCTSTASVTVVVKTNTSYVNITASKTEVCKVGINGNNAITLGGTSGGVYSVNGNALTSNLLYPANVPAGNNVVTHTITSSDGCSNSASMNILIDSVPVVYYSQLDESAHKLVLNGAFINVPKVQVITNSGGLIFTYTNPILTSSSAIFTGLSSQIHNGDQILIYYGNLSESCVTDNTSVSVQELVVGNNEDMMVYPNPSADVLHIFTKEDGKVEVMNMLGQVVRETSKEAGTSEMYKDGLPSGQYFIKFTAKDSSLVKIKRIVIQ